MFLRNFKKTNSKGHSYKNIFISSALTLGILGASNISSKPLLKANFFENSRYSNKSFITDAVEKTGASVVTIETQRYLKKRKFSKDSRILIDPYSDRFFGLQLPYEYQPKIEQSQGSGFIFENGLIMTNAHVVNGSDRLIIGLTNGKKYTGKLLGQDFLTDLAIIKVEGKGPWQRQY